MRERKSGRRGEFKREKDSHIQRLKPRERKRGRDKSNATEIAEVRTDMTVSVRTCRASMTSKVASVTVIAHVMFALSCIPNTSGSAFSGND